MDNNGKKLIAIDTLDTNETIAIFVENGQYFCTIIGTDSSSRYFDSICELLVRLEDKTLPSTERLIKRLDSLLPYHKPPINPQPNG